MTARAEVGAPRRKRRRILWSAAAIVAVGAAVVVGIVAGGRAAQPKPEPTQAPRGAMSAAQETYILYTRWTEGVDNAACLGEHGFPYEPYPVSERARAPRVAAFLGIAPNEPTTWLAPASVRNTGVSYGGSAAGASTVGPSAAFAACPGTAALVNTSDSAAVADAVKNALADPGFRAYLAEARWLYENPVGAALIGSRPLLSTRPAPDHSAWQPRLDRVLTYLASASAWRTDSSEAYDTFAQAVGHAPGDALVVVRVASDRHMFDSIWYTGSRDPIDCGGVFVAIGYPLADGFGVSESASLNAVAATLDAGVCAALG